MQYKRCLLTLGFSTPLLGTARALQLLAPFLDVDRISVPLDGFKGRATTAGNAAATANGRDADVVRVGHKLANQVKDALDFCV